MIDQLFINYQYQSIAIHRIDCHQLSLIMDFIDWLPPEVCLYNLYSLPYTKKKLQYQKTKLSSFIDQFLALDLRNSVLQIRAGSRVKNLRKLAP